METVFYRFTEERPRPHYLYHDASRSADLDNARGEDLPDGRSSGLYRAWPDVLRLLVTIGSFAVPAPSKGEAVGLSGGVPRLESCTQAILFGENWQGMSFRPRTIPSIRSMCTMTTRKQSSKSSSDSWEATALPMCLSSILSLRTTVPTSRTLLLLPIPPSMRLCSS